MNILHINIYKLFIVIAMLGGNNAYTNTPSEKVVRDLFKKAAKEESSCKTLVSILEKYNEKNNPLMAGYRACATMMLANYTFFPINKLQKFSEGKDLLEKSIKSDPENIELRFLRFTVQNKSPNFLGYNKEIDGDKTFILNSIAKIDNPELKKIIIDFLSGCDRLTINEKNKIKS